MRSDAGESSLMIETDQVDAALVIALKGRLDSVNAGPVEAEIVGYVRDGANRVVLDFGDVPYISSAGLRVVLVLAKRLREVGGKLALFGMVPSVREVFSISGFLQILTVCDDRETALAGMRDQ